jgi:hypothetical protein
MLKQLFIICHFLNNQKNRLCSTHGKWPHPRKLVSKPSLKTSKSWITTLQTTKSKKSLKQLFIICHFLNNPKFRLCSTHGKWPHPGNLVSKPSLKTSKSWITTLQTTKIKIVLKQFFIICHFLNNPKFCLCSIHGKWPHPRNLVSKPSLKTSKSWITTLQTTKIKKMLKQLFINCHFLNNHKFCLCSIHGKWPHPGKLVSKPRLR